MAVRIHLPGYLRPFAGARPEVTLATTPGTVRAALAALGALHPGVVDRVLTEQGELRRHVNVFVGDESIRYGGGLDTPLRDGAEIAIVPAVSGG
jgi:sulfur-carrier protein